MTTFTLHGHLVTSLDVMRFNKYCSLNNISLNTLSPAEHYDLIAKWIKN